MDFSSMDVCDCGVAVAVALLCSAFSCFSVSARSVGISESLLPVDLYLH